jgi:hypothetical protein
MSSSDIFFSPDRCNDGFYGDGGEAFEAPPLPLQLASFTISF